MPQSKFYGFGHVASYYTATAHYHEPFSALENEQQTDVCIIGAGFTGLASALALCQAGYQVTILESQRIAYGASGRSGGVVVARYARELDSIARHYGQERALQLVSLLVESMRIIPQWIEQYQIDCDLNYGALALFATTRQLEQFQRQLNHWQIYSPDDLTWFDEKRLYELTGTQQYIGALLDPHGFQVHPLNLALGEAAALNRLGGQIFEHSPVVALDQRADRVIVKTPKGTIKSRWVIVAGNAYLNQIAPLLQAKSIIYASQVIATEPLTLSQQKTVLAHGYCAYDPYQLLEYFRITADKRIIFGAGILPHSRNPKSIEAWMRPRLAALFPSLASIRFDYRWSGLFLLSPSRLPQIAQLNEQIYYAQAYGGFGMHLSHLAGQLLSEAIQGQDERFNYFATLNQKTIPAGRLLRKPLSLIGASYYALRRRLKF